MVVAGQALRDNRSRYLPVPKLVMMSRAGILVRLAWLVALLAVSEFQKSLEAILRRARQDEPLTIGRWPQVIIGTRDSRSCRPLSRGRRNVAGRVQRPDA